MKVYLICKIIDNHKSNIVHGFTDSKSMCNMFMKSRKKGLYYVEIKDINKHEYEVLKNDYIECILMLPYGAQTKIDGIPEDCEVISTLSEYRKLNLYFNDIITSLPEPYTEVSFFKDKYFDALKMLLYTKLKKVVTNFDMGSDRLYEVDYGSLFVKLFGNELRE